MIDHVVRPEHERVRCGSYIDPLTGQSMWGDHRVTIPDSKCEDVNCAVAHHPTVLPGWAEPMDDFHDRPGAQPIAAALWGWDAAGLLRERIGDTNAWVAAHVALDALRDAGYTVTRPTGGEAE